MHYEDRLRKYKETSTNLWRLGGRRYASYYERLQQRKIRRQKLVEALNKIQDNANRFFSEVKKNKKLVKVLLDTGASVSLLVKNCRELVEELDIEIENHFS